MWGDQRYYNPNVDVENPEDDVGDPKKDEVDEEYELPPLPDPRPPEFVNGIPLSQLYDAIRALKREVDDPDPVKLARIRDGLMKEVDLSLALFQVLHESNLLRDKHGNLFPIPTCPPPMLPPGIKSWIYKPQQATAGPSFVPVQFGGQAVKQEVKQERR